GQAAAEGLVSTKVTTLAEGVLKTMFRTKLTGAGLVLLAVALAGAALGLAGTRRTAAATEEAKTEERQPSEKAAPTGAQENIKVRGRVLDPEGKPFAGAKLYLGGHTGLKAPTYPVRATSGEDGSFAFTFAKSELDKTDPHDSTYQVLAVAK